MLGKSRFRKISRRLDQDFNGNGRDRKFNGSWGVSPIAWRPHCIQKEPPGRANLRNVFPNPHRNTINEHNFPTTRKLAACTAPMHRKMQYESKEKSVIQ